MGNRKKTRPISIPSARDSPQMEEDIQIESEGTEKDVLWNGNQKKTGVFIPVSDKINIKIKTVK